tara:strand:- start:153 stop:1271 length:1119 start_codon:yes stop_codon:yes gene_type:complete
MSALPFYDKQGNQVGINELVRQNRLESNSELKKLALENFAGLEGKIDQAQKEQVIQAKQDYLALDEISKESTGESNMSQDVKNGQTNIMKSIKSIKPGDNTFLSQVSEYLQNIHKLSKSNDASVVDMINAVIGGTAPLLVKDGKKVFDFGNNKEMSMEMISSMMDGIKLPAMRQNNDLINSAADIAKEITSGVVPEERIDQAIDTIINTSPNAQDTDPNAQKEVKESFALDSLGGKPSMQEFFGDSKEFQMALKELQEEGSSDLFDNMQKVHIRNCWFTPAMEEKIAEQTKQPTLEVDFNNLQSVEDEINRLENLSQEEKFNLDYSEGSVEGSIIERLAKLKNQREALGGGFKSDLDKTPEWKQIQLHKIYL